MNKLQKQISLVVFHRILLITIREIIHTTTVLYTTSKFSQTDDL